MTDNRTTELCKLLEERGVQFKTHDIIIGKAVTWHGNVCDWVAIPDEKGLAVAVYKDYLTPEQAIAATLGNGRNTSLDNVDAERDAQFAKAMRRIVEKSTDFGDTDIEISHIKADELMCDLLLAHGYTETVDEFKSMRKWYA